MKYPLTLVFFGCFILGCNKSSTPAPKSGQQSGDENKQGTVKSVSTASNNQKKKTSTPPEIKNDPPTAKTVQDAREEFQNRINRFLGGQRDPDLIGAIFSISSVLVIYNKIEIDQVLQRYDNTGKKIPNEFIVSYKASGADKNTGESKSKSFQSLDFRFDGNKWIVK